jgi:RNA polymerase sigma-70 factor (ECF subfamily)
MGLSDIPRWEHLPDVELVALCGSDVRAFGELVRRHQDFVYGAALRVVRDPTIAEDLAQEAFLRAYRGLPDFRYDSQLRSWLYRIVTNLALNAVTRKREYAHDGVPLQSAAPSAEHSAHDSLLADHMHAAIAELPEDLRRCLVLREYEGMSYQQIADATGLPLNTVRTRILRARRALRLSMEAWR